MSRIEIVTVIHHRHKPTDLMIIYLAVHIDNVQDKIHLWFRNLSSEGGNITSETTKTRKLALKNSFFNVQSTFADELAEYEVFVPLPTIVVLLTLPEKPRYHK
jgi:hypothetical protein